jgi:SAM-dependent methyltransferase
VPIRGVRSNSFDFVEVGRIEGFVPGPGDCAGPALDLPGERYRHVLLWRDDGVVDFRTDTGDFSGDEIREIKEVRQQLLVDTGTQVAMADFQRDVRQVRLCEVCRDCPSRKDCASAWRIDPGTPFRDEEDWLRGELGRIRGRVLDVGCGDLLYQDVVRDLVEAGRITYEGLDPDCGALDRLRASRIDMKIHAMDIEDFDGESGAFDHVLMLRSINHFKDLARAFRIAARLLRAGGTLVVADCIPFALLRSRAKAETAHASAAPLFEHYRNFTSEQFLEFLDRERLPFAVSGHRPIGPGTGNLWLVRLERTDRASP